MSFGKLGSIGRGTMASAPTQYLFIDGGCLRQSISEIEHTFAAGRKLGVDFSALTAGFHKVFYYDALPSKSGDESDADYQARHDAAATLHDRLGALDRFHVYEGETRRSLSRKKQEQKKVDIMIAVDMLTHSFRRNMEQATLLTADLDFKPLLDALVTEGMFVTLWYPPNRTSPELIKSADRRRRLDVRAIHPALTPSSRVQFSIPRSWGQQAQANYTSPLKTWRTRDGDFSLFESNDEFVIEGPHDEVPGYWLYHAHSDLNLLTAYSGHVLLAPIPN
jgi:uncharacterized LabA/DUF88 family protein